jgi:magnesium chelatase family protein
MGLALVHTRARAGVRAPAVRVEVHVGGGLPSLTIVGLPQAAVREAKDRVRAAIQCAQFEFPDGRIIVNLAPADLPKSGGRFDLPIALGILAASGQVSNEALRDVEFVGELGLTGELRAVDGVLPAAIAAMQVGHRLIVPEENGGEAALVRSAHLFVARTLSEVCASLAGEKALPRAEPIAVAARRAPDLGDVRGQAHARRALEIAAAGQHHVLFVGTPGCGKTLLASRLAGLLPEASEEEALESAAVASISGRGVDAATWRLRPYRAPHHSTTAIALVGTDGRPGEVSLAHNGVLFLDELPEWGRHALQMLREPMETGHVVVSRAARQSDWPARFQLVAAMNPCPCGWAGDAGGRCRCNPEAIGRYRARISGPLLDRIDLHVDVLRLPPEALREEAPRGESSAEVRARVVAARERQVARAGVANALLDQGATDATCRLAADDRALLERAIAAFDLSARSLHRILRVARTIADLDASDAIVSRHLAEAIGYRTLDRDAPVARG